MIETKDLTKTFDNFTAVDSLNLKIEKGEFFGLLGPNGAGKTTTISLLSTLLLPTKGEILIDGQQLTRQRPDLKRKISVITQEYSMRQDMNMDEIMEYQGRLYFMPRKQIKERTEELLEFCDLLKFRKRTVRKLSGGMKRKLMVCRALLTDPEILLLDEPTAGMDALSRRQMWNLLRKLNEKNLTILLTTHYMEEAQNLCNRVALMDHGKLEAYADDASVLRRLEEIKHQNKLAFAAYARKQQGVVLNTDAIFDVQVKRLHEYKRQLLNVLHIIYLYQRLQDDPNMDMRPQTFLFGAKAAPGYAVAKRIIHLINSLAAQIDRDPICKDKLQVVFLENYRVSLAEMLMPASEVSQQISTAGKEASGTGNMKFMMNGALTVGTLDGANVEMHERLGDENMFLFGLHADEVVRLKREGYAPQKLYARDENLRAVIDKLKAGFSDGVSYDDLASRLLMNDEYMLLQDFASYCAAEQRMADTYARSEEWNRMSLINIARSGIFAADRAVAQYADTIWHVPHK